MVTGKIYFLPFADFLLFLKHHFLHAIEASPLLSPQSLLCVHAIPREKTTSENAVEVSIAETGYCMITDEMQVTHLGEMLNNPTENITFTAGTPCTAPVNLTLAYIWE